MRKTAFGTFADWLLAQIPAYVSASVKRAVDDIPKPKDGKTGKQGVSVVDAEIAVDDHLVLKLSNGKEIDAGELPKASSESMLAVSGNAWQIDVSASAPAHPQVNQLWLATNVRICGRL